VAGGRHPQQSSAVKKADVESFCSTLKHELGERFDIRGTSKLELFVCIEVFYNQQRRYSTLGQISPSAYERQLGTETVLDQFVLQRQGATGSIALRTEGGIIASQMTALSGSRSGVPAALLGKFTELSLRSVDWPISNRSQHHHDDYRTIRCE